ncbi:MAG: hypothetical protein HKL90_04480 [Elusimicrobia bacterium]|nr:hypothetical protein [Elusimicrobiota bacterium]
MQAPWNSVCPICRHEPREHGEQGRCAHGDCSCRVDLRIFSEPRPPSPWGWPNSFERGMADHPFRTIIYASCALFFAGLGCDWLATHLTGHAWVHALFKAIGIMLMVLGLPGIILERFYVPHGDRAISPPGANKILIGLLSAAVVLTAGIFLADYFYR